MFVMRLASVTLLLCLTGSASAQAPAPKIGFLDPDAPACFSRAYSADHMKKHPRQKVTDIAFSYVPMRSFGGEAPEKQWYDSAGTPSFNATVVVKLKGETALLLNGLFCQGKSKTVVSCIIDEDGGAFLLTATKDGVQLDNPMRFDVFPATGDEDSDMAESISIKRADDHAVFLMPAAKGGLCSLD